ncbi:hypothetical protein AEGHOMDF_0268 [Methylobacterium soli]|nr:hypothetical protein AEGHOMDF_0268 [Methylobacterium soli]
MAAKPVFADRAVLEGWTERLARAVATNDRADAEAVFEEAIPDFRDRAGAAAAAENLAQSHPEPAPNPV